MSAGQYYKITKAIIYTKLVLKSFNLFIPLSFWITIKRVPQLTMKTYLDEMSDQASLLPNLHCANLDEIFLRDIHSMHHKLDILSCDPFKFKIDRPSLIV